jgi:hypothetical protein
MTLPDQFDTIAPRDGQAYAPAEVLREMFVNAHTADTVLTYYDLQLQRQFVDGPGRVWDVYTAEDTYIETLNLDAYRTVSELEDTLKELAACDPGDRADWVAWSR